MVARPWRTASQSSGSTPSERHIPGRVSSAADDPKARATQAIYSKTAHPDLGTRRASDPSRLLPSDSESCLTDCRKGVFQRTAYDTVRLEGKKLAITAGDALTQLFPAFAGFNKLDTGKITLVQIDPAGKVVALLEKRVDAILGGLDDQYFLVK